MRNESAKGSRKTKFRLSLAETIFLFLYSDQCLSKSVSENCQSVEGAREERASSPQPSPPEEERERISQTRSKCPRRKNFLARLRRIYGNKLLPGNIVVEEREKRPY